MMLPYKPDATDEDIEAYYADQERRRDAEAEMKACMKEEAKACQQQLKETPLRPRQMSIEEYIEMLRTDRYTKLNEQYNKEHFYTEVRHNEQVR